MTSARTHPRLLSAALVIPAAAAHLLAGCTNTESPVSEESAAALSSAQTVAEDYLSAVAAADLETIEALSAQEALVNEALDVTEALAEVDTPISHQWIEFLGADTTDDQQQYTFQVSYRVGEAIGADRITLEQTGDDPADPAAWTVIEGLLDTHRVTADPEVVHVLALGSVELGPLSNDDTLSIEVSGYPGGYQVEVLDAEPGVSLDPGTVTLGAEAVTAWDAGPPLRDPDDA